MVIMAEIGTTDCSDIISQEFASDGVKLPKKTHTFGLFEDPAINLTPEFTAHYSNVKERAKLKIEND